MDSSERENLEIRMKEQLYLSEILIKYGIIGKRALIITNTEELIKPIKRILTDSGIELPAIPKKNLEELTKIGILNKMNPLNILDADSERYKRVLKIFDRQNFFDFFVVLLTPQAMTRPLETAQILHKLIKPTLNCFIGQDALESARDFMNKKGIIHFENIAELKVLGKI
jgi:acetyltransferase